jgi:hypothetical protein
LNPKVKNLRDIGGKLPVGTIKKPDLLDRPGFLYLEQAVT